MKVAVVGANISRLLSAYELAKSGVKVVVYEKEHYLGGHPNTVTINGVDLDLGFMVLNCKKNVFNPYFWQIIREIIRFKQDVISYLEELYNNPDIDCNETLGQFIGSHGYSVLFMKAYLVTLLFGLIVDFDTCIYLAFLFIQNINLATSNYVSQVPICASIWSCRLEGVMGFSAYSILSFCRDHHLLQVKEELEKIGCQIRTGCKVNSVSTNEQGCTISCNDGATEVYDGCIIAVHAPDTLKMLGKEATYDETRILSAFHYVYSDTYLHHDKMFLPRNLAVWSACNFFGTINNRGCTTYWLNIIQNLGESKLPYLVTVDPPHTPEHTLVKWRTNHLVPSVAASKASRYGFNVNGLKVGAGAVAADCMLRRNCSVLYNPKHLVPTWPETGARLLVTRFFKSYIQTGCIILLEGGTIFTFQGTDRKCSPRVSLTFHNMQFYWKVATQAGLGLADAFIHGDFSFVDKNEGLLNLFMIFIANRDLKASVRTSSKKRCWWTPLCFTSALSSAKYFIRHVSNWNTLTQARQNISLHYNLSEDEDLKVAQLRKISLLIEKQTGCKYTGITLSEKQLEYALLKVEQAGLQDQITFLLCDYRQIPNKDKYDRFISCEMLEAVGHEFMEEFFTCCEYALAEDGLLVLQCSAPGRYRNSLLSDTEILAKKLPE
ncbi:hypothetical protein RDI58_010982 [Solanum bulbocastanum]|uniref:Amine oxidase domain-containing protein n=1 Tax=Solanum bulbocastanum TaxID=147425 RepID=A0AAN8TXB7_SOLBU